MKNMLSIIIIICFSGAITFAGPNPKLKNQKNVRVAANGKILAPIPPQRK